MMYLTNNLINIICSCSSVGRAIDNDRGVWSSILHRSINFNILNIGYWGELLRRAVNDKVPRNVPWKFASLKKKLVGRGIPRFTKTRAARNRYRKYRSRLWIGHRMRCGYADQLSTTMYRNQSVKSYEPVSRRRIEILVFSMLSY